MHLCLSAAGFQGAKALALLLLLLFLGCSLCLQSLHPVQALLQGVPALLQAGVEERAVHHAELLLQRQQIALLLFQLHASRALLNTHTGTVNVHSVLNVLQGMHHADASTAMQHSKQTMSLQVLVRYLRLVRVCQASLFVQLCPAT